MPRPHKNRRVRGKARSSYFKPAGIPVNQLEIIILELDEFEALRLKDVLDLDQENSAKEMNVSQPTFQRILKRARQKVAKAIIQGKAIQINTDSGNIET
jgi:uncharacterized protein